MKRYNMTLKVESICATIYGDNWNDYLGPAAFIQAVENKQGSWITYRDHTNEIAEIVAMIVRADPAEVEQFLLKYKDLQP